MSRIGKLPVVVPAGVTVVISPTAVSAKGSKGELTFTLPRGIEVTQAEGKLHVTPTLNSNKASALHGLVRAELANLVTGVSAGWSKTLELVGVGYRANMAGVNLNLAVGYSHPVIVEPVAGVEFKVVEGKIIISGINKQIVGETAARIRAIKPPEPYKGKGIRYSGEHVRKKAGKAAKAVGGAK